MTAAPGRGGPPAPDAEDGPVVGVVVVTYSPGETLAEFLDSVPSAWSGRAAVVIADNGSTDGSVEAAAARPGVELLRTGGNLGFGTAANRGVAALPPGPGFVLIANPDVVLHPGSVDALVAAADRHPAAAALGPAIVTPDGELYPSARRLPTLWLGAGHALVGWVWPTNPWTRAYRQEDAATHERAAGWLSGSCLLVRRAAFEHVGGFDERYFMYFEDVDLCERLGGAGWQSVYVPEAVVTHIGGHATIRAGAAMVVEHHRSAYRYLSGRYPAWYQAPVRGVLRGALWSRAALARRSDKLSAGARFRGRRLPDHEPD